jgi:hypothetical protein
MSFAVEQSARASVVFAAAAAPDASAGAGTGAGRAPGVAGATDRERSAVPVELRYDARAAPRSVSLSFAEVPGGPEHAWVFARDLLERGLRGPAGSGAVRVWPSGRVRAVVELHSDDGVALVQFDSSALARFLRRTYREAPTAGGGSTAPAAGGGDGAREAGGRNGAREAPAGA